MQDEEAIEVTGRVHDRPPRKLGERLWRAVGLAPRTHVYAVLGMLLALAVTVARLCEVGLPADDDRKFSFLVVTYSTVAVFALLGYLLGRSFDDLRRLSITDPLTGLYNRRHFAQRLEEESRRARRYGHAASVLYVDVDRMKTINDDFGHKAGDGALVAVGRALMENVRSVDVVARIGGDEFAVLLPETSVAQASAFSQRVLAEVAWQGDVLASGLSISIGIAELNTAADAEPRDLMVAADDALHQVKAAGGGGEHVRGGPAGARLGAGLDAPGRQPCDRHPDDHADQRRHSQDAEAGPRVLGHRVPRSRRRRAGDAECHRRQHHGELEPGWAIASSDDGQAACERAGARRRRSDDGVIVTRQAGSGAQPSAVPALRVRRVAIAIAGFAVLLLGGALLVVPVPGTSIIVIPLGLAILAREFRWAKRLHDWSTAAVRRTWAGVRRLFGKGPVIPVALPHH